MTTDLPGSPDRKAGAIGAEVQFAARNAASERRGLGVALSGGGVRATLFSLGALMYLVDSGYSRDVTIVSSVSGGSITNALIAQDAELASAHDDPAAFDKAAKRLVRTLTEKGLLSSRLLVLGFVAAVALCALILWWFSTRVTATWWVNALLTVGLMGGLGVLFLLRGHLLSSRLKRLLFTDKNGTPTTLAATKKGVRHIFCATDLNSGKPFYFTNLSDGLMGNTEWGMWRAGDVSLADAVRSSAAFPGAFTPKRLKLNPQDQVDSVLEAQQKFLLQPPARDVFLADGGVWNNLGTGWFDEPVGLGMVMDPKKLGEWSPAQTQRLLVINASAPLKSIRDFRLLSVPFIAEFAGFFRFINVLYSSTVFPRLERLYDTLMLGAGARSEQAKGETFAVLRGAKMDPAVVQIDQDHWRQPVERLSTHGIELFRSRKLAGEIEGRMAEPPPFDVELVFGSGPSGRTPTPKTVTLANLAAGVPTTLSRIAPDTALQVLLHGYLSTWRVVETIFGPKPTKRPSMERFAEITGVRNLTFAWQTIAGRSTLVLHFRDDTSGTREESEPIPEQRPRGDPGGIFRQGIHLLSINKRDEAADWFLKARMAGTDGGEPLLEQFYRTTGFRPGASASEDQVREWTSWNEAVAGLEKYYPARLELMVGVLERPPEARKAAVEALPEAIKRLPEFAERDEASRKRLLETSRAALARIQGSSTPPAGASTEQREAAAIGPSSS